MRATQEADTGLQVKKIVILIGVEISKVRSAGEELMGTDGALLGLYRG